MPDTIEIIISSPDGGYTWDAWIGDEQILAGATEPLFEACRVLLKRGVDPKTKVATRHAGQPYRSLTTTVGYGAATTVKDPPSEGMRFVRYRTFERSNNDGRPEPASELEPIEGTGTAPDPLALNGGDPCRKEMASYEPG